MADASAGGGVCPNSVSRAAMRWCVNFSARPKIGACGGMRGIFRRGFHRKVDWKEALLMVCSSVGMEVAEKSLR